MFLGALFSIIVSLVCAWQYQHLHLTDEEPGAVSPRHWEFQGLRSSVSLCRCGCCIWGRVSESGVSLRIPEKSFELKGFFNPLLCGEALH